MALNFAVAFDVRIVDENVEAPFLEEFIDFFGQVAVLIGDFFLIRFQLLNRVQRINILVHRNLIVVIRRKFLRNIACR